jgi:hypothetical protein
MYAESQTIGNPDNLKKPLGARKPNGINRIDSQ